MKPLLVFAGAVLLVATRLVAAPDPLPPIALKSVRGKAPARAEGLRSENKDTLYNWSEQLTPEQRTAWSAAMGQADPEMERTLGSKKLPTAVTGYDWRTVARFAGLSDSEIARLGSDKLLLEDVSLRQSFAAYTEPPGPVFITSDSALNAMHVLFEDSFRELETRRVYALRTHLEDLVKKVRELLAGSNNGFPASQLQPGWRHAQCVIGPALRLLGTPTDFFDADTRTEIEQQVGKIRAATAVELPAWLAPQSPTLLAIDYRRCKPTGFYTDSATLQDYFRAVRWLQSVPFRADRDDELTAIGLLGYALMEDYQSGSQRFFRSYASILGRPDNPALPEAAYEFQNFLFNHRKSTEWAAKLVSIRLWLLRSLIAREDWAKLNDSLRLPPQAAENIAQIQFRVLSAYRLPDSVALARLGETGHLPSSLVVATLLGSDFARRQLANQDSTNLDAALTDAREAWHSGTESNHRFDPSLYDRYLDTLAALSLPAEPDAPGFMRSKPWAAKSCQTILASWAQMRHTFTLQAKVSVHYLGLVDVPPGFVEPNPEFFRRLADWVGNANGFLDQAGVFLPSSKAEADRLRRAADDLENLGLHLPSASVKNLEVFTHEQVMRYESSLAVMNGEDAPGMFPTVTESDMPASEFQKIHREMIAKLRARATALASGEQSPAQGHSTLRERWDTLKSVTRRLEALAHKQLRQQPWSPEEERFIRGYGEELAFVHGYFGNSWLTPRDDSPRWASVASDPKTDKLLAVAVGRARLIHVLYPYQNGEVLCTGSVMTFYEYPARQTLTDEEWRLHLDSDEAPALPEWILPYFAR